MARNCPTDNFPNLVVVAGTRARFPEYKIAVLGIGSLFLFAINNYLTKLCLVVYPAGIGRCICLHISSRSDFFLLLYKGCSFHVSWIKL